MDFFAVNQKQSDAWLARCLRETGPNLRVVGNVDSFAALGALVAAVDSSNHKDLSQRWPVSC